MKLETLRQTLLFDYYGELLTDKQKTCFDLYYNQDLSLAEIAQMEGISRQGVHDTLARAEAMLQSMEEKTGCVARALQVRRAMEQIDRAARPLLQAAEPDTRAAARQILDAAAAIKE